MQLMLILILTLPFIGFIGSLLFNKNREDAIAATAITSSLLTLLVNLLLLLNWIVDGSHPVSQHLLTIYRSGEFDFGIDIYFDKLSAVYSLVAAILLLVVSIFSKYYMHRENGFKRFYNHFMLFSSGIALVILSGNFETFFLGWEIVGISSFLLIAFYRDRYLPVRNALKVLSFYRLGDVALVGAFWFTHHMLQTSLHFNNLSGTNFLAGPLHDHPLQVLIIGLLLVWAASVKSAQFPFSSWLPRAIEGPTVSSAIFYGSLSVHLGVFLLLRTSGIWMSLPAIRILVILIGLITIVTGTLSGSVQATAKTQIAYSSLAQIGFMFIEIGLGWHTLALLHLACNAFLRTYQFLVSPAVMNYKIHYQFFHYDENRLPAFRWLSGSMRNTLYLMSLKEWNLDFNWFWYIWRPLKRISKSLHILRNTKAEAIFLLLVIAGFILYVIHPMTGIHRFSFVSLTYSAIALALVLIAWTERQSAIRAWVYILMSQVFFMLSIAEQHTFDLTQVLIYISGTLVAFLGGLWCLYKIKSIENSVHLFEFHGHIYEHPKFGLFFLICALTIVGFPISPTFLGLDILFSDIELNHRVLLIMSSFTFVILELSVMRIYARVFLGQHVKTYHEVAFRSS